MAKMNLIPEADYIDACNAVREKDGTTEPILSGALGAKIRAIKAERAKLLPATISLSDDTLSITNGNNGAFATAYHIYADGADKATVTIPAASFDLKTLSLAEGSHPVYVVATGTNMDDSVKSNEVTYTISASNPLVKQWTWDESLYFEFMWSLDQNYTYNISFTAAGKAYSSMRFYRQSRYDFYVYYDSTEAIYSDADGTVAMNISTQFEITDVSKLTEAEQASLLALLNDLTVK